MQDTMLFGYHHPTGWFSLEMNWLKSLTVELNASPRADAYLLAHATTVFQPFCAVSQAPPKNGMSALPTTLVI